MTTLADVDPIVEYLDSIHLETGHDRGRIFKDWMALAVAAFARDDDRYNEVLDAYPVDGRDDPDDAIRRACAEDFAAALGELTEHTVSDQRPVLGGVYEQVGRQSDALGQHFTPWNVSLANAELTIHADDVEDATADDPLTVCDPACGSGRLLIAVAKAVHDRDPDTPLVVTGVDKDRTCARMAVVNLVLGATPGRVYHGNSLTMETWRRWDVRPSAVGPAVRIVEEPADLSMPDREPEEESEHEVVDATADPDAEAAEADVDLGAQTDLGVFGDDD